MRRTVLTLGIGFILGGLATWGLLRLVGPSSVGGHEVRVMTGTSYSNGDEGLALFDSEGKYSFGGSFIVPWSESESEGWHDGHFPTCVNLKERHIRVTLGVLYVPGSDEAPFGGDRIVWMKCHGAAD